MEIQNEIIPVQEKFQKTKNLEFEYLPRYAQFLLENKLRELASLQISLSRELDLPILKFLGNFSDEQLVDLGMESQKVILNYLSQNQASRHIEEAIEQYKENQIPHIQQEELAAEDITLIIYIRKKTFTHFLPDFTRDPNTILMIVHEIDHYLLHLENAASNLFIQLLQGRIKESSLFIEKITSTSPGIIYVFDIEKKKQVYTNRPLNEFFGFTKDQMPGKEIFSSGGFLHPDDVPLLEAHNASFSTIAEGETISIRIRLLHGSGEYRWVRCFETVFKRNDEGKVCEIIGICIDVHDQKKIAEKLEEREAQLLEAHEIAKIGSFTWDFNNKNSHGSEQTKQILEVDFNDKEAFFARVHEDDRTKIEEALRKAEVTGQYDCEYRYKGNQGEKIIWTKGIMHYKDGKPVYMHGTVMDVTEKQILLEKLKHQQKVHNQVEELANMGNWSWDLRTQKIEWSDNLYKIYGLDPQSEEITIEKFLSFIDPADKDKVSNSVYDIKNEKNIDYTFRIRTKDGKQKIIRSIAQVEKNKKGKPIRVIGTERDVTERQNILNNMKKSEALYKQAQALAHIGNWTWETETDKVDWSEEIYNIYEIDPSTELSFEKVASFIHPDDREMITSYLGECIREEKTYDKAHRIILQSGKEKVIHRRAEVVKEEGRPVKLVGTTQDITEIYHVQQELRENQNFIRKITDATPSVITTYNVNTGQYVFISEGLEKLMGYDVATTMEEGIGFFLKIIHPEDLPMVMEKNKQALEMANADPARKDIIAEFTYRIRHKSGEFRWYNTYGTIFDRNANGQVEHVLNITLDVTEQQIANEKIKEQEHFIQQIADASPTILYLYDVESQSIEYINREIFFVLGYAPDEIIQAGNSITNLLYHPEDYHLLPARKQSGKNFSQVDSMMQYECRMKTKDEEWRWVLVREIVFKTDSNGNIQQVLGAALDINRRKEMEKTILQNTFLLEQSNASLEEFAYVASHDLKEPLRKISTFGDRLATSHLEILSPEGKLYMNKILDASQRMQTMISDLLSISMITGNRSFEKYSLQKILDETLQTLEYKIEQQNAVIRHDELPEANIIPSQFRQLFQNLLSNSLKFVKEGVQPVISISYSQLKENEIQHYQLSHSDQYTKLKFSDNGIGFESEFTNKIFAIFQRLHGRSEYEGSGIGLAICKKIVEHHGGIIYAESSPGAGATFTIILPG